MGTNYSHFPRKCNTLRHWSSLYSLLGQGLQVKVNVANLFEMTITRIRQEQDQGLLWLNGQATPVELSSDFAGNTFATARNITLSSTPTTFTDWVGSTDRLDYYS